VEVWSFGPWVALVFATVVAVGVGRVRWLRGREVWPALPIGLVLYVPMVVASVLALI
jgi:hypothetical protein